MTEPLSPLPAMRELIPAFLDGLLGDNPIYRIGKMAGQLNADNGNPGKNNILPDDVYAAIAEIRRIRQ